MNSLPPTPRAKLVLAFARQEAERLHHPFIGPEHVLLGLLILNELGMPTALKKLIVDLEAVRLELERAVGHGLPPREAMILEVDRDWCVQNSQKFQCARRPYAPSVKRALALAAKEAEALNHIYVGTEHILLALIDGGGAAGQVLQKFNVTPEGVRHVMGYGQAVKPGE